MQRFMLIIGLLLTLLMSGCSHYKFPWVYRIDIEQGNIVDTDKLEEVKIGMTEKQVEYLLGSPLIEDTFNQDRWDYFYSFQTGEGELSRERVTLFFENGRLKTIEKPEYKTIRVHY